MSDEKTGARRTALGREELLDEHEKRLDDHAGRIVDLERTDARREKRWDTLFRAFVAIASGIIIGIVVALLTSGGGHP